MFRKTFLTAILALGLGGPALAAGEAGHVDDVSFSFEGPFGTYDAAQLQRGLQVYTQACAACHGLQYVPIRTLGDATGPDMAPAQVSAYAALYEVFDPELDDWRTATPNDHFPAVTAAGAPDLSLMAKARVGFSGPMGLGINQLFRGIGGPEYIVAVLSGYTGEDKEEAGSILYENTAFGGGYISMAPPLWDGMVEFADGSDNSVKAMATDVAAFLMWSAEPKLEVRKKWGLISVITLLALSVLLYLTNKKLWAPIKRKQFDA